MIFRSGHGITNVEQVACPIHAVAGQGVVVFDQRAKKYIRINTV